MKKLIIVAVLASAFVGCQKEAEKFGYKGADLENEEQLYFTANPAVTNWLPARVLSVDEQYEFSDDEKKLVAAAGVVWSGDSLKEIPAGFAKRENEPWFVTWVKEVEAFGKKGTSGFLSHFDEDKGVWVVGETFFSTYWKTPAEAMAAIGDLEKAIVAGFNPLKIHKVPEGFVAEYRRMRVIAVAGPRPNGTFSCMLSFKDKNRAGCGEWEPVPDQEERVKSYKYMKALKAWRAAAGEIVQKNHAKVEELRKAQNLSGLGEEVSWFDSGDGSWMCCQNGQFETEKTDAKSFIAEKSAEMEKAFGVKFEGEPEAIGATDENTPPAYFSANAKSALYEVRVDVAASGEWRVLVTEQLQSGFTLPPHP